MPDNINLKFAIGLEPEDAVKYFEAKGFKISFDWREMLHDAHAKAFTVAGVTQLEVLKSIRESVNRAVKDGITLEEFKKGLKPRLEKLGWWGEKEATNPLTGEIKKVDLSSPWRLKTIYDTNMQTAYMAGRYTQLMENVKYRPYWEYIAVLDKSTRPSHAALNGKIYRYDDPIWNYIYPPNDWGCRCAVRARRAEDVPKPNENDYTIEPINKNGVDTSRIRFNDGRTLDLGAGWDYNPGKASWKPDLTKYDPADVKQMTKKHGASKAADIKAKAQPQGLAQKIKVKKYADIKTLMDAYALENPDIFERGFINAKIDNGRYFMATDCKGTIYISKTKSLTKNFTPAKDLKNALSKIGSRTQLTFPEEYSIESLWHEINHNRVKTASRLVKGSPDHITMETLNQFVSRHTYDNFLEKLGGTAEHKKDILEKGYGYSSYVANFRTLLDRLKIDENAELSKMQDILFDDYKHLYDKLALHISNVSGKSVNDIKDALQSLKLDDKNFDIKLTGLGF